MSSSLVNNISICVSDEESDELAGRRVRVRRKRKKPGFRSNDGLPRRISRVLRRWWPALLFLPAIGLLLFEASKLAIKPRGEEARLTDPKSVKKAKVDPEPVKELPSNLNRLDAVTRVVGGVRQPCLKLLSPDKIQDLEFPESAERNSPIKRVVYKSDSDKYHMGGNMSMLGQNAEATRFNLFTGFQTGQEREKSFKANETAVVHCGFYSDHGGFKISDDDKSYMETCKAAVSTCAFGGGDDLYQPIGMTKASLKKVCYVAFWDVITRTAQEAEGIKINEKHMIGTWRIIVIKDLPFSDQRLNGKSPRC